MKNGYWEIRPLKNNVLLGPLPKLEQSAGGILLPNFLNDDRKQYIVLAVGPAVTQVQVGDRVLAELVHSHLILDDGTDRRICPESEIVLKWETTHPIDKYVRKES